MCNNCDCENYEQCSIKGYQPYGACCSICSRWDEAHTCEYYELKAPINLKSMISQVLPKEKKRAMIISIEQFP